MDVDPAGESLGGDVGLGNIVVLRSFGKFFGLAGLRLGFALAAVVTRTVRSSVIEELGEDYVRTARAKGLAERTVLYKHVLKNSLIPVVTNVALALPGVFAGSLLTFIPAMGDYINAELLGNPQTRMIGNVIQNRLLVQNDYPVGSALSFILMAAILVAVAVYARALGTEQLTG